MRMVLRVLVRIFVGFATLFTVCGIGIFLQQTFGSGALKIIATAFVCWGIGSTLLGRDLRFERKKDQS